MANSRKVKSTRLVYNRRSGGAPRQGRAPIRPAVFKRGLAVFACGLGLVATWHVFAISTIQVQGSSSVNRADVVRAVQASLDRHPLSRNLLSLGLAPIEQDLLADQRLATVDVKRLWPSTLTIIVSERQLSLAWKSGAGEYVLDSDGVAISVLEHGPGALPEVTDSTSLPVHVGESVVPGRFVNFTTTLAREIIPKTGLGIASMMVPDTTSELYVKTTAGYSIKFDTTSGVEEQLTSLKTVLATLAKLKKAPAEYIDLRVPNKAYYR